MTLHCQDCEYPGLLAEAIWLEAIGVEARGSNPLALNG
jgi:hypothetical protein